MESADLSNIIWYLLMLFILLITGVYVAIDALGWNAYDLMVEGGLEGALEEF